MEMQQLCVHFDINKTIILSDASSGKGFLASVQSLLSECCWGYFRSDKPKEERTVHDWVPFIEFPPSATPPIVGKDISLLGFEHCLITTFGTFVEDHTTLTKQQQKLVKTNFVTQYETEEDKAIGVGKGMYMSEKGHYQSLLDKLRISDEGLERLTQWTATHYDEKDSISYLNSGYYHILPSFFHTLTHFAALVRQSRYDVRIVFRSFGVDIANVAHEVNLFCEGKHPLFVCDPPLDGTDSDKLDFRLRLPNNSGSFLRTGKTLQDIHLAHLNADQVVVIDSGASAVYDYILYDWLRFPKDTMAVGSSDKQSHPYCIAIRDNYDFWRKNRESDDSGKLLLIDKSTHKIIQIFFDDNIERDRSHIIDVRDKTSFDHIPFEGTNDVYIRRVEPLLAIENENYFIHAIEQSITSQRRQ